MRLFISVCITAALSYVFGIFMPWWSLIVAALLTALFIDQKAGYATLGGFIGCSITWLLLASLQNQIDGGYFAGKMAILFKLNSPFFLLLSTALIAGLVGSAGALCGSFIRDLTKKKSSPLYP